jgi:hypothetical protein
MPALNGVAVARAHLDSLDKITHIARLGLSVANGRNETILEGRWRNCILASHL